MINNEELEIIHSQDLPLISDDDVVSTNQRKIQENRVEYQEREDESDDQEEIEEEEDEEEVICDDDQHQMMYEDDD